MASLAPAISACPSTIAQPVLELYFQRLPNSLLLAAVAMALSLLIGIPSGILAAVRVDGFWDSAGKIFSLLGLSLPSFWVGLVLILFFSVYLGWLPSSGSGSTPASADAGLHARLVFRRRAHAAYASVHAGGAGLGIHQAGAAQRACRRPGDRQARAQERADPGDHLAGINLVVMINVAVVVETVFAWPGIGRLLYEGITFRDFPIVQGVVIIGGAMIVLVNLLVDILYAPDRSPHPPGKLNVMTVTTPPLAAATVAPPTAFWR
jgi:peptide/nickel transport system permease protein